MDKELLQRLKLRRIHNPLHANSLLHDYFTGIGIKHIDSLSVNRSLRSLHSINGLITYKDESSHYFRICDTPDREHTEQISYQDLTKIGCPVIQNTYASPTLVKGVALFTPHNFPSLFDLLQSIENTDNSRTPTLEEKVTSEYREFISSILQSYLNSLETGLSCNSQARIHQILHERIKPGGRYSQWYRTHTLKLENESIAFAELEHYQWIINGVVFRETLAELINQARTACDPRVARVSVMGHGDWHQGNLVMSEDGMRLHDYDNAGRHCPFLDMVKASFHDTWAKWMYQPEVIARTIDLSYKLNRDKKTIEIWHDYQVSTIRQQLWEIKKELLIYPIVEELERQKLLPNSWKRNFQLSLLCASLMTMNLLQRPDSTNSIVTYSPAVSLLGFATAIELSATNTQASDSTLL